MGMKRARLHLPTGDWRICKAGFGITRKALRMPAHRGKKESYLRKARDVIRCFFMRR